MKKLILTGSSSRIAQELNGLIPEGIEVIAVGRSDSDRFPCDFRKVSECARFAEFLVHEKPAYLFLNHGVLVGKCFTAYSESEIQETLGVNLLSYITIFEALTSLENLRTVVTSSISGTAGSFDPLYAATKAGIDVNLRAFARRIPPSSRLNAIAPGIIADAKMTLERKDTSVLEKKRNETPTREFTKANEVARFVEFVLFRSSNMNGEIIHVNGGLV